MSDTTCGECYRTYSTKHTLKRHMKTLHRSGVPEKSKSTGIFKNTDLDMDAVTKLCNTVEEFIHVRPTLF